MIDKTENLGVEIEARYQSVACKIEEKAAASEVEEIKNQSHGTSCKHLKP